MVERICRRLFLVLLLSNVSCAFFPRDGLYLIPEGLNGGVIILYDQRDGRVLDVEDGRYVYRIPANGVLKVKDSAPTGTINRSYYFVTDKGDRSKINYLHITGERSVEGLPQNKFGNISQQEHDNKVFVMSAGGVGSFNTPRGIVQFTSFIISTPKDSSIVYRNMEDRIFDIQKDLTSR